MRNPKFFFRASLAFTALILLSSCETVSNVTDLLSDPIILACPENKVLADAAKLVLYAEGGGRDLTDVDAEGKIADMRLICTTKIDEDTMTGTMDIEVVFDFAVTRGPANKTRKAIFPYFVSINDSDENVLKHQRFIIEADFSGNRNRFSMRNQPTPIPIDISPGRTGKQYVIYGGFSLTKEQLQLHRLRRSQGRN